MANEFRCSYCGGDGTRCRCIQERRNNPEVIQRAYGHLREVEERANEVYTRKKNKQGKIEVTQEEWDRISDKFARENTSSNFGSALQKIAKYMSQYKVKKSKKYKSKGRGYRTKNNKILK